MCIAGVMLRLFMSLESREQSSSFLLSSEPPSFKQLNGENGHRSNIIGKLTGNRLRREKVIRHSLDTFDRLTTLNLLPQILNDKPAAELRTLLPQIIQYMSTTAANVDNGNMTSGGTMIAFRKQR